jgi:hypothetical protein
LTLLAAVTCSFQYGLSNTHGKMLIFAFIYFLS